MNRFTHRLIAIAALLAAPALAGCGAAPDAAPVQSAGVSSASIPGGAGNTDAPASREGSHNTSHATPAGGDWSSREQALVLLTRDDIEIYLAMMRAGAERVRHPTAEDLSVVQKWQAFLSAGGKLPPPDLSEADEQRATYLMTGLADEQVAVERGFDIHRYEWIKGTIEGIILPPAARIDAACGYDCNGDMPAETAEQIRYNKASEAATGMNKQIVAPFAAQIDALEQVVYGGKSS